MKALASDFDGTLFFSDRSQKISSSDVDAIKSFQSQGHLFGFCTGRTIEGILEHTTGLLQADFYITNSGACILNKNFDILFEKTIPKTIADTIIQYGIDHSYTVDIHMDGKYFAFLEPDEYASKVLDSLDAVCGNVHNISFDANTHENAANLATRINDLFAGQVIAFQNTQYVDIAPFGCSKGTGIDFIRNLLNIQSFSGIGDSMNDLPMLKKTDISFTFSDSPKAMQEQADYIVTSVADAILKL